ncbi:MAG: hypothetical protein IPG83_02985 [Novosphingobium sp.]|nr:hypothetical protein [Novosphingobium sp.]
MTAYHSLIFVLSLTGGLALVFAVLAGLADYALPALAAASRRRSARRIQTARPQATYR